MLGRHLQPFHFAGHRTGLSPSLRAKVLVQMQPMSAALTYSDCPVRDLPKRMFEK